MMGERTVRQESLFYGFALEEHVPADHLLRSIDRFVELSEIRRQLEPYYSEAETLYNVAGDAADDFGPLGKPRPRSA